MAKKAKKSKWMYTFVVEQEQEVEEETQSTNDKGEEITIKKKVTENVPVKFKLRRPTRRLIDDADLFYSIKLSEGIKAGLLTRTLIARRYDDDGGIFGEKGEESYREAYQLLVIKESEYQKLHIDSAADKSKDGSSEETTNKLNELLLEIQDLRSDVAEYEQVQQGIFNQTAENRARNATIMWWVLNISYMENNSGEDNLIFQGNTYDEKLDHYDDLEENADDFIYEYIRKLAYLISYWYTGNATKDDDFKVAEELYLSAEDEENDVTLEDKANERELNILNEERLKRIEEVEKKALEEIEESEKKVPEEKKAPEENKVIEKVSKKETEKKEPTEKKAKIDKKE